MTLAAAAAEPAIELINHQPFAIRMPITVNAANAAGIVPPSNSAVQRMGDELALVADVPAGARAHVAVGASSASHSSDRLAIDPQVTGIALHYGARDLGRLEWAIVLHPAKRPAATARETDDSAPTMSGTGSPATATPDDFAAAFAPLPLDFQRSATGPVCEVWTAEAVKFGLRLHVDAFAYAAGFLDLRVRLRNEAATQTTGVYAAILARWAQPEVASRTLCEDNRIRPLPPRDWSLFRRGEGRHLFTQRGVDWIETAFRSGAAAAWLNDFAPSFTVLDSASRNTFGQPRYEGANLPLLGQEVQTADGALISVTEIARANIRSYRDRLAENVLPARGEAVTFSSRITFSASPIPPAAVDEAFVGYTSYNAERRTEGGVEISFGVSAVKFGTAYLPYSTLGENFDTLKLPGMDRESFWPLAADTVLRWRDFADDIRRDLRLIKAMGFQVVRLHHLELLAPIPADTRTEYLDFLFGELRHLQLRAMLDVYATPEAIAALVARYRDVVDAVELENEILIWGIPLDRPEQWKKTYAAVKAVAPDVAVNLTAQNNTGIFDRLAALGVPFDRVGLHSYVDSLDALATARGYALALGSYASKTGKPPVITEWNWRGLTRMTPEARAKIYPAIFENALATRAIPELHQFQFNETLAPNPRVGRGNILRHYELVHLSRRPKLEAFELLKLIEKYAAADNPVRRLEIAPVTIDLDAQGRGSAKLAIRSHVSAATQVHLAVESTTDVSAEIVGSRAMALAPNAAGMITVDIRTATPTPGFYYAFVRLEEPNQPVRYGWIEARLGGRPKIDVESAATVAYPSGVANTLALDFSAPCVVEYGAKATVLEIETAIAIAETLESATGHPVEALQADNSAAAEKGSRLVILVGSVASEPRMRVMAGNLQIRAGGFVTRAPASTGAGEHVFIGGERPEDAEHAGMDFLLRYWKFAKDSATRRIGLEKKTLPRGIDATKLP